MCVCDGSMILARPSLSARPTTSLPCVAVATSTRTTPLAMAIDSPVLSSPLLFFSASEANLKGYVRPVSPRRHGIPAAPAHPGVIKS